MDLIFPAAWAQTTGTAAAGGGLASQLMAFAPIVLIFFIFYFLVIRPQNEEAKKHAAMVAGLKSGDMVLTQAGFSGEIIAMNDRFLRLRLADGIDVTLARESVARLLTDDERKDLDKLPSPDAKPVVKKR